jgi:hypothetical protein
MYRNSIWWALVVLSLVAVPLTAHAAVVNLVKNPSFEEDEVILDDPAWDQWCTWGSDAGLNSTIAFDDTEAIDGDRSLRVEPKGATTWYFMVIYATIPMKVGTQYTASFWAKAQAPRSLVSLMKATDNSVSWGETTFQLTTDWAEYSFTASAMNAAVKWEIHCAGVEVPLWLDFCYVYEGPYVAGNDPSGAGVPGAATRPSPENGAVEVPRDVVVGWKAGQWANTHDVYLGTSQADVTAASVANPLGVLNAQGHDANSLDVGRLEFAATYYWRVDEVNAPPSSAVIPGKVWSFTVEPRSYAIAGSHIIASASSVGRIDWTAQKTVNGSGLNANDQHSTASADMWISAVGPAPVWIMYAFDQPYVLDKLMVWNSNQSTENSLGVGAKDVTIEYSIDGSSWTALGDFVFNRATAKSTYTANTEISFGDVAANYVRITIKSNWGNKLSQFSLSEVRFFSIPVLARQPYPASGATNVGPQVALSWRAGRQAALHDVYLSTDPNAVADGTAPMTAVAQAQYKTAVDLAKTYYWQVVEVNEVESPSAWPSEVWSFTTADFIPVEDFERYGNNSPNRVFQTWIDGGGFSPDEFFPNGSPGNDTGSFIGYDPLMRDIMETSAVHGGTKSAPFFYDNTASTPTSETTRTFDGPQDWTQAGVETLTLCFYGDPNNTGSGPLWVKVSDGSNSAKVTFGVAAGELATALDELAWTEWKIPLSTFAGVNLTKIASMTVGMGPGTGSGKLFLDDIRLYPARSVPAPVTPVLVAWWKLDNNAQDSSGNGNNGTLNNGATYAAAGKIGAALSLDGIDDYVDCGNDPSVNITDVITVAAWVKTSDTGNAQHNPFVIKGDTSYGLKHNTGNFIEFFIYDDGAWYGANSPILTTAFNSTWHHVAGTYDGAQTKLYIDGKLVGSRLHTGQIAISTYNLALGRNGEHTDRLYYGLIDEVRIYHGVLPSSEIAALANP